MAHVAVVDQTLGQGQHVLWNDRLGADMILPIAAILDRVGYKAIDRVSQSTFSGYKGRFDEDPWEELRLLTRSFRHTPIRASVRCPAIVENSALPEAVMELWVRKLCEYGVKSFCLYDPLHDHVDQIATLAALAARNGCEVVTAVFFTEDSVHTDSLYADIAKKLASSSDISGLVIWDIAGVLTPMRVRSLVPAILEQVPKNLEILSHNVIGISPLTYLEGLSRSVQTIHSCCRPLANGSSLPSIEVTLHNLQLAGHSFEIRQDLLLQVADHFRKIAERTDLPIGKMSEYDLYAFEHQLQGGISHFLQTELGPKRKGEMDKVLIEMGLVRKELGYPPMVAPFSTMIQEIALSNILTKERYAQPNDTLLRYVSGYYGNSAGPIDSAVEVAIKDSLGRKASATTTVEPQASLTMLRNQHKQLSEEEFITRHLRGGAGSASVAESAVGERAPFTSYAELDQITSIIRQAKIRSIDIESGEISISLLR